MSAPRETPEQAAARLAGEQLAPAERARLWRRIEQSSAGAQQRAPNWLLPAFALAAALVTFYAGPWSARDPDPRRAQLPKAEQCDLDAASQRLKLAARCAEQRVVVAGDEWALAPGAELTRVGSDARVQSGRVRFKVQKRTNSSFRVFVSHGLVRVIGTAFQIEQLSGAGSILVTEGVVEFVWDDGVREQLTPGQSLRWPRADAAEQSPPPEPSDQGQEPSARPQLKPPKPPTRAEPEQAAPLDLERVLARLLQLKSQKRFAEAVALLEPTLKDARLGSVQRERISYELGLALEANGSDSCAHWREHAVHFGTERRKTTLTSRLQRCRPPD